jgi:hypothetical protein
MTAARAVKTGFERRGAASEETAGKNRETAKTIERKERAAVFNVLEAIEDTGIAVLIEADLGPLVDDESEFIFLFGIGRGKKIIRGRLDGDVGVGRRKGGLMKYNARSECKKNGDATE